MKKVAFGFLIIFVFSLPWQSFIVIPSIGTVSRLFGFGLVGIALLYILFKKNLKQPSLLIIAATAFVFWGLISYIWSINPVATIGRFITNIQLLAMVWLVWELCNTKENYYTLLQVFVLGLFVSIYDMLLTYLVSGSGQFRVTPAGFNPNRFAIYLSLGIPIAWYLLLTYKRKFYYWVNIIYIPLALFCIILTASRTGFIVGLAGLTIIPLTYFYLNSRTRRVVVVSAIAVGMIVTVNYSKIITNVEQNIERLATTQEVIEAGQYGGRGVIWKASLKVFKENAIIGVGSGASRFAIAGYLYREERATHNTYLSILVDLGVIGFSIFLLILIISLIPIYYSKYYHGVFYIVLLFALLIGMIPSNLEVDKIIWFIIATYQMGGFLIFRNRSIEINTN